MEQGLSRKELLDKIEEAARNYEFKYHGCSRCVLAALQEHLDLGDGSAFKASNPLGGGIAMMGDTCGALIGGLMAIGLVTASENIEDEAALTASIGAGYRFFRKFNRKMGSTRCRDILTARFGYYPDLTQNPEGYEKAKEAGLYDVISKFVGEAARLAAESILELQEKEKASHK